MNFWDRHNRNRQYRSGMRVIGGDTLSPLGVDFAPASERRRGQVTRGRFASSVTDADRFQLDLESARRRRTVRAYEAVRREVERLNRARSRRPRYASTPSVALPRVPPADLRRALGTPRIMAVAMVLARNMPQARVAVVLFEYLLANFSRQFAFSAGALNATLTEMLPHAIPDPADGWGLSGSCSLGSPINYHITSTSPTQYRPTRPIANQANNCSSGQALGQATPWPDAIASSVRGIALTYRYSVPGDFRHRIMRTYWRETTGPTSWIDRTRLRPGTVRVLPQPVPDVLTQPSAQVPSFTQVEGGIGTEGPASPPYRRPLSPAKRFRPPVPGERERKANIRNQGFASVVLLAAERASEVGDAVEAGYDALPEWRREMIEAELGRAPTVGEMMKYVYRYNTEMDLRVLVYNLIINEMDDRIEAFLGRAGKAGVQMTGQGTGVERAVRSGTKYMPGGKNPGEAIRELILADMERAAGAEPGTLTGGGIEDVIRGQRTLRSTQIVW